MKHLGDITKIRGDQIPAVDCITGGSPCQDLSVAGRREGLAGARSGLFMEQIRIIKEMREHDRETNQHRGIFVKPRYMVWENVAGAFSSNGGEDFRAVLEETARIADADAIIPRLAEKQKWSKSGAILGDGWSIAWRLHDAQFWGVPQRRQRISLVADFGGSSAPEILFERKGMSRDFESSGEEREGSSGSTTAGIRKTSEDIASTIKATSYAIDQQCGKGGANFTEDISPTLASDSHGTPHAVFSIGNGQVNDAMSPMKECSKTLNCLADPAKIITTSHGGFMCNADDSGIAHTLQSTDYKDPQTVCYGIDRACFNQGKNAKYDISIDEDMTSPLVSRGASAVCCSANPVIRRLTPLECERLQGFPDGWTDIGDWIDSNGKKHSGDVDTPRYKAIGNSIALPFWFWLLRRISAQYVGMATLGSLFDGIGGFPLCWERCNGKGSAIWASEIEEFPIAVTKYHFPDEEEKDETRDIHEGNS